jgi:YD repeat-containing protein
VTERTDKAGVVTRYTYDPKGRALTTTEDASQVYARLFTLSAFTVEVERDGQRLSLIYAVTKN